MASISKNRNKVYKRLREDIWGKYIMYKNIVKMDKVLIYWGKVRRMNKEYLSFKRERYTYKLWGRKNFALQKRLKMNYIVPRILKNFYIFLNKKMINKKVKEASKTSGFFIENFIKRLENRLVNVLYRVNMITNIFIIKNIIKSKIIRVNNKIITFPNYIVKLGDFVELDKIWIKVFKKDIKLRLKYNVILSNIPLNIYINYIWLYLYIYRDLKVSELIYPTNLDIYRALDFIGPLR